MHIVIGSDQGGFEMKEALMERLTEAGITYLDVGTFDPSSVDYPDIAETACAKYLDPEEHIDLGILICGTGIGIGMAANKVKGIRCANCSETYSAKMARRHNNANFLSLGGRTLGIELAWEIIEAFLNEPFEGGRHQRRVDKIMALEA